MLIALAFCPAPPLLVPAVAAGAAGELDGLRQACRDAVGRLLDAGPDRIVVLGPGPVTSAYGPGSGGTLAGFGVSVVAAFGAPVGPASLPPALTLGAWLLDSAPPPAVPPSTGAAGVPTADVRAAPVPASGAPVSGAPVAGVPVAGGRVAGRRAAGRPVTGVAVGPEADPAAVAAGLVSVDRVGLLVMGDGSARRSECAPGYVDPRADGFDAAVAAALAGGDAAALRDLNPVLGAELLAAGVPPWRVVGHAAAGTDFAAELLYDEAPYGVGYLVATWTAR